MSLIPRCLQRGGSLIGLVAVFLLVGCGSKLQLPDNPKVYEQRENSEAGYTYLA